MAVHERTAPDPVTPLSSTDALQRYYDLCEKSPARAQLVKELTDAQLRHTHRIEWALWATQLMGVTLGFAVFASLIWLAKYFVDHGATAEAAGIFSVGTVPIIALFVTGRVLDRRIRR